MTGTDAVVDTFARSVRASDRHDTPYPHWFLEDCLPAPLVAEIDRLPFVAPDLGGVSGKRELHNNQRVYFDVANRASYPSLDAVASGFQDPRTTRLVSEVFGTRITGSSLRIEYAQDVDGFWLEPHTDLGVKLFTMLIYMSKDPSHADLGTDIYDAEKRHVGRSPFKVGGALIFVPSSNTYHGFERRPINGVRKSIIINYVTQDWRAREQLAFPDQPIV